MSSSARCSSFNAAQCDRIFTNANYQWELIEIVCSCNCKNRSSFNSNHHVWGRVHPCNSELYLYVLRFFQSRSDICFPISSTPSRGTTTNSTTKIS